MDAGSRAGMTANGGHYGPRADASDRRNPLQRSANGVHRVTLLDGPGSGGGATRGVYYFHSLWWVETSGIGRGGSSILGVPM